MVVLEDVGMMSTGANQYLQPDYLSPLPTTLDAKRSPLALLAQTCSQIGADTPSGKQLAPPPDKKKPAGGEAAQRASPVARSLDKPRNSPDAAKHLAFKPYEVNVVTRRPDEHRPSSKTSVDGADDRRSEKSSASRKSSTPTAADKGAADRKSASPAGSGGGASPVVRSGLEMLGHAKDHLGAFKHLAGLQGYPSAAACCPPGADPLANPAFRPPFAPPHALAGFPAYLGYARVKTPTGGEALVPVCKDPYCAGCQLALHPHAALGACPAGCAQCEHQKYGLAAALAYPPYGRPYVCNWIAGEAYCGKRFGGSEELLQHLRAHAADAPGAAAASLLYGAPRAYGAGPPSPLARYHPYGKAPLPPFAASPSLASFYAPYALYGQRLGAAVHH